MKQHRNGIKIINWRKPFDRDTLSQRFRRRRDTIGTWDGEVDDCWNPADPRDDYDGEADDAVVAQRNLDHMLQSVLDRQSPFRALLTALAAADDVTDADAAARHRSRSTVEERLSDHLTKIQSAATTTTALEHDVEAAILYVREVDVVAQEAQRHDNPSLAQNLILFAPFWIRSPLSWHSHDTTLEAHLFTDTPIPHCLHEVWRRDHRYPYLDFSDDTGLEWLAWAVVLGQGGSLERLATLRNRHIAPGFTEYFYQAPEHLSPPEAATYAEVIRRGGNAIDYTRTVANRSFVLDPTEPPSGAPLPRWRRNFHEFWDRSVSWMIQHGAELTDDQSETVLAWALDSFDTARASNRVHVLHDCSVETALEQSYTWAQARHPVWIAPRTWTPHGLSWEIQQSGRQWSFVELTSTAQLRHEGLWQQHCVATYWQRCVAGTSAIVSLQVDGELRLTIDVRPDTRHVAQARGFRNRPATPEERHILDQWADTVLRTDDQ